MDVRAIPLVVSWRTSSGQLRPVVEPQRVLVDPPDVLFVDKGQKLRCRKNGDGVVRVYVKEHVASAPVKCLLSYQLRQTRPSYPYRLVLGEPPEPSGIHAYGNGGVLDRSVAVTVTSMAPDVLAVDGDMLVPKRLGRALVTGTAQGLGESSSTFEVVNRIGYWQVREPFKPISVELAPGKYELSFYTTEDELLTVKWSHFPQCNYSAKATAPVVTCSPDRRTRMTAYPPRKEKGVVDYLELIELPP
jgi:hypothetical protein